MDRADTGIMRSTLTLLVLAFLLCAEARAESAFNAFNTARPQDRPAPSVWSKAVPYGTATAHEPRFEDKALWPHLSGREQFLKTVFPKARVLIWAKPGTSGNGSGLDPLDPKHWIDEATGKPATALPDIDTDIVLPAAASTYSVDFQNPGHGRKAALMIARCVTVGANAHLYMDDARTRGHVWVRRGGSFMVDVHAHFVGSDHTFFRNENDNGNPSPSQGDLTYLCQYLKFNKATRDASTEFLGQVHSFDEFQVLQGTLIVGADSIVEMGREASPYAERNAVIALMDNAYFGKWIDDLPCHDLALRGGTLQGGMPDRPLTRNALFRVGTKNWTKVACTVPDAGGTVRNFGGATGLIIDSGSTVRSWTKDPKAARLVIGMLPRSYPINFMRPALGSPAYEEYAKRPGARRFLELIDGLPPGITIWIGANVTIDGVEFDGVHKGGLRLAQPSDAQRWKNVFYGKGNFAEPKDLIGAAPNDEEDDD